MSLLDTFELFKAKTGPKGIKRLNKVTNFVCDLMNKEKFYNWTVFDVLLAVKNCALSGSTILPKEVNKK